MEYTVKPTPQFEKWLKSIRDPRTRARLLNRLGKVKKGLLGDVKPVGDGVMEMREFFGPGWRMYYTQRDSTIVLMLGGGDKSSQEADIKAAIELLKEIDKQGQP